ncbi:lactonase family protein [Flagellimonas sp. HMM57]|uniref:lactonase family protein n=1 Tax=unclassified Flagellimonas TaxID=2644544 RepID=UPI0013D3DF73|nr:MULTISPECIES: lactonase family protein [unclassified Flagellimonas]UII74754.1 lactonase family protein [Flagellimonas sp. HMM57]
MALLTFFIGSYTEYLNPDFGGTGKGIYTVQLNEETGEVYTVSVQSSRNPSYLTISMDNQFLYCTTELDITEAPQVQAYKIHSDYSLQILNQQSILGTYPCHLSLFKNTILTACYGTGNMLQFPLMASGELKSVQREYRHSGSGSNKIRQEAPHAHHVAVHPNQKDVYVCDLGVDTVKAYTFTDGILKPNPEKDCEVTKGGGPRHLVFNIDGSIAYVINELTANVSVLKCSDGVFQEIATYASLPMDFKGIPSASAIRFYPNKQVLYVANRSLEAISIFKIIEDTLELLEITRTGGEELREFNITPDGKWLLAGHQNSHDLVVYKIEKDGRLSETYRTREILSPVCITFLN